MEGEVELDIKTQKDLNMFFGLKESNDIYVNGCLINKSMSISTESIKKIELMKADDFLLKTLTLNILI